MDTWGGTWGVGNSTYIPWTTTGTSTTTTGFYIAPLGYGGGGSATAARQLAPLEWLDAEVEKTCALARAAS